jgi:DNA end-binding protein Ku
VRGAPGRPRAGGNPYPFRPADPRTGGTGLDEKIEVSKKELDMGLALINQFTEPMDLAKYKDEYHDELLKIIAQKAKGKHPTIKKLKPAKGDDLFDQLMSSLTAKEGA